MTPGGIDFVRRADLSIKPRSGLAEAGHDPRKCVRPELMEHGGVSWCTPAGKKTSIDSLSYGNGHLELYPDRYN